MAGGKRTSSDRKEEILFLLRSRFKEEGPSLLAQETGLSVGTLSAWARGLGLKRDLAASYQKMGDTKTERYDTLDLSIWEPLSQIGAYYLGLFWSDGSVRHGRVKDRGRPHGKPTYEVSTTLMDPNYEVLFFLADTLKLPHTRVRDVKLKHEGCTPSKVLTLRGKRITTLMIEKFGILPCKSEIDPAYPRIPDEFLASFARGVYDGDGTSGETSAGIHSWEWYGSPRFIAEFQSKLCTQVGLPTHKISDNGTLKRIQWSAKEDCLRITSAIHKERESGVPYPYMKLKHDRHLMALNH